MKNKLLPYFLLIVLFCYLVFLITSRKLQLNVFTATSSKFSITNEHNEKILLSKNSGSTNNKVVITNVNKKNIYSKGNEIFFTPIETEHGGKLSNTNSYKVIKGDWKIKDNLEDNGKWYSTEPGSIIEIETNTSNIYLNIAKHPFSGIANINWNGKDIGDIDLYSSNETWEKIKLETPMSIFYSLISPKTKELHLNFNEQKQIINRIEIIFGNDLIFQQDNVEQEVIEIGDHIQITIMFIILKNIVSFLLKIIFLISVYFFVGLPLVISNKNTFSYLEKIITSIAVGTAFTITTTTTMCFFVPVKISFLIFIILIILIYSISIKKNKLLKIIKSEMNRLVVDKNSIFLLILAILATTIVFLPAIIESGWFFGHSYTDSFEYINLSQIFVNTSPKDYGFKLDFTRIAETIFLSVNSLLLFTTTQKIYVISAAFFWFQLPFIIYVILKKINIKEKSFLLIGTIVFSFSANLYSLFSQSYLAQYFFIFSLMYGIFITLALIDIGKKPSKSFLFASSIIFVMSLILYPYHFFLPISLFITGLTNLIFKEKNQLLKSTLTLGIIALFLLNINSTILINFKKNKSYDETLNSIGRHIVFPFYKETIDFGNKILGIDDLILNSDHMSEINNELYKNENNLYYISDYYLLLFKKAMFFVSVAFLLIGIIYIFSNRNIDKYAFLFFTLIMYLLVSIYLYQSNQVYMFGKLGLTIGNILLVIILVGVDHANFVFKKYKTLKHIFSIFLLLLLIMNMMSINRDNSLFYLNRNSILLYKLRTQISTVSIDLKNFEKFVNSKKIESNGTFLIIGNFDDVYKTDKDRVFNNRILQILNRYNVKYGKNLQSHIFYQYDFGYNEEIKDDDFAKIDYMLLFNGYNFEKINNKELILKNNLFKIYKVKN